MFTADRLVRIKKFVGSEVICSKVICGASFNNTFYNFRTGRLESWSLPKLDNWLEESDRLTMLVFVESREDAHYLRSQVGIGSQSDWFVTFLAVKFTSLHRSRWSLAVSSSAMKSGIGHSILKRRAKTFVSRPMPRLLAHDSRPRARVFETGLECSRDPRPWFPDHKTVRYMYMMSWPTVK